MTSQTIINFLRNVFHVRKGEELRIVLMILYIFFIISSLMIVKPVCIAIFLHELGASKLPFVFILVAIFASIVAYIYLHLLKFVSLNRLIYISLLVSIGFLLFFWGLLFYNLLLSWILYSFYITVAIGAIILVSQFWILANHIFNHREAKRLFGILGSGAIAGGIFGGYLTKFAAPIIGSENLLIVCILFLTGCIPIVKILWNRYAIEKDSSTLLYRKQVNENIENPFLLIKKSKYLTYLTCIIALSVVMAKLVEFQYGAIASSIIIDEDQLAAFFGFWFSNLNIVSLLIQLFITPRVVGVFGVGSSLFFLPGGIFLGALTTLIHPTLWSAIVLRLSDGGLKNSINKAGIELLFLPVPSEIKKRVKSFIDIFIDSAATGVGGIFLAVITFGLGFSIRQISLIMILFLCIWIYLIMRVRQEYINAFRLKIERNKGKTSVLFAGLKNESIIDGIIKVLSGKDERQIVTVLNTVRDIRHVRLMPCFQKLLSHSSSAVRAEVLRNLYFYDKPDLSSEINGLIFDDDQDVKTEALHYLFQHKSVNRIEMLLGYINHADSSVRNAALLCADRESKNNTVYRKAFKVRVTIEEKVKSLGQLSDISLFNDIKTTCAKSIGAAGIQELYRYLYEFLHDKSETVVKASIISAGQTQKIEFIPILLNKLEDSRYENCVSYALRCYGPEIINSLVMILNNYEEKKELRLRIPRLISSFEVQMSVETLFHNIEYPDYDIRREIIRALNKLRVNDLSLRFNEKYILKEVLEEARLYTATLVVLYSLTNKKQTTKKMWNRK